MRDSLWRKVVSVVAAICMTASLCPASALATDGTGYAQGAAKVEGQDRITGATPGSSVSTDVNVAVTSAFEVVVKNDKAITIGDDFWRVTGEYSLKGSLSHGQPMKDGDKRYYEYKWVRDIWEAGEGASTGSWKEDTEYNASKYASWKRVEGLDAQSGYVELAPFNLYDVRDALDFVGQAHYRYRLVARDSVLERASSGTVEVVCSSHYAEAVVSAPVGSVEIYAGGIMHVGDPRLDAKELGPDSAAYGLILKGLPKDYELAGAYDTNITEQQAAEHSEPAYLEPLQYIDLPVDSERAKAGFAVYGITSAGNGHGTVLKLTDVHLLEPVNAGEAPFVRISSGATEEDGNAALVCGVFALAYKSQDDKPSVKVTSKVEGEGGLIDIMGAHYFAQGTTVRYTFLPSEGHCLDKVVVTEGDILNPTSVRTYIAGEEQEGFQANWLDYTVNPSNPKSPKDVTITAHFAEADTSGVGTDERFQVEAIVKDGEGAVRIDGGKELSGNSGMWTTVRPGGAVTVHFIPGEGSVLDYVKVKTSEGDVTVEEFPQVINNALTLPAVTADTIVEAYFKWGTPVIYPDLSIAYDDKTTNGSFGDANPDSAPYGSSVSVQVVADAGYKVEDVWFTFDDDTDATRYPLRYSGGGTSWIIDYVLGNITVHVSFVSTSMQVKVVANEGGSVKAAYTNAENNPVANVNVSTLAGGIISDLNPSSDLQLTVTPNEGKVAFVYLLQKDGTKKYVASDEGKYTISNTDLASSDLDSVQVEFRDVVVEALSVGLSMPEFGVKVYRTDMAGAGEIAPGTTSIENIDPKTGLALRVELVEGYKDLAVQVKDAEGNVIHTATIGANGEVTIAPEFLGAANTVVITCERAGEVPPRGDIEVIATTDGNGGIFTNDKTSFKADEELTDITYSITASEGYELDYIAISGSNPDVAVRTFAGIPDADTDNWKFTLGAAFIANGYDRVLAVFKQLPRGSYWVTPVIVDSTGAEVFGENAHGSVSPMDKFEVVAGGVASLSFMPQEGYRAEVAIDNVNGSWTKVDRLSYSIGMDGGITQDTTVYVRFIEDSSAEQRETHTIHASVSHVDGQVHGRISPEGNVQVAHRGSVAFSFFPDEGYELSYVLVDGGTLDEEVWPASALASTNGQFIMSNVTKDHTVHAIFAAESTIDNAVTWQVSAGEHGSADPSGTVIALVSTGGRFVNIVPDDGYVIDKVIINGQETLLSEHPNYAGNSFGGTFLLPAVKGGGGTFHVTFAPRPTQVALHVKVNGSGGTASPLGDSVAIVGAQQTITFIPEDGYKLSYARYTNSNGTPLSNGDFTQEAVAGDYSYTFTMRGETWVECAFERLAEGEEPPVEPVDPITINAVSVGYGVISPFGALKLYPNDANSKITFTLIPNAGAKLVQMTVGGRDVTSDVQGGVYTLLAKDAKDGDEVRAVFEKPAPARGKIELTAGNGGQISPSGTVEAVVGNPLPVTFLPAEGMMVESVQLTYMNEDGSTWTKTIPWAANFYTVASVTNDLVEVHVTFKEASGSVPVLRTAKVKAKVVGDASLGSVSPAAGNIVEVAQGASALYTFAPSAGCTLVSAKLGGKNLVQKGATRLYVSYAQLVAAGGGNGVAELEVTFEKLAPNPDYVNIVVDVNVNINGPARSGIDVGAGGIVSPTNIRVPYGSSDAYAFYVFPDEGYKLESIAASVDGGAVVPLTYAYQNEETGKIENVDKVNDISSIVAGGSSVSRTVPLDGSAKEEGGSGSDGDGGSDGAGAIPDLGAARYYMFQLGNITGNVDVQVDFVALGDDEKDDAISGDGKRVTLDVSSSEGGFISPSGTVTLPEGCTYPFLIEPESSEWEPVALVISYADGTKKIIDNVKPGRMPIKITADMTGISVSFEQIGTPSEMVTVNASAEGPGSISPAGTFQAKKGEPQGFTFKFDSKKSYIKSLVVTRADGTSQDLAADGWVWKFDPTFFIYDMDSDVDVRVEFAEGDEDNPMWDAIDYVRVVAGITTEGKPGGQGGTISPSGEMWLTSGMGSQLFCFQPNRGYIVDSVGVIEGSGAGAKVYTLSAEEIASREYLLANISDNAAITVNFIPTFYTVDVTSSEGGSFDIEGKGIKVRQGQKLSLYAEPDSGHELERIDTKGLVVHEDIKAEEVRDQVSRTASLGGRAKDRSELHTFAVAGSGAVHGTFMSSKGDTEDPSNPSNPSDPGKDPSDPSGPGNPNNPGNSGNPAGPNNPSGSINPGANTVEAGMPCKVVVSTSGNGEVNPKGELSVISGSTLTLTLTPAVGFYPVSVTIKDAAGTRTVANATRTYSAVITGNCELIANFATSAAPGSANPINRTIRTLQSLAKTGDNAYAGILALTAIACAGVGVMILTSKRRRKEEQVEE